MNRNSVCVLGVLLVTLLWNASAFAEKETLETLKKKFMTRATGIEAIERMATNGESSVKDLIDILKTKSTSRNMMEQQHNWRVKVTAMNLLGEMKSRLALFELTNMLRNSERLSAIYNSGRAIGNIGSFSSFIILKNTLKRVNKGRCSQPVIRKKASILGLGLCGKKMAIPMLLKELNNIQNDELTRVYAAGSLGMLGNETGYKTAMAALYADDAKIRSSAIEALGLIGKTEALEPLMVIEEDSTEVIPHRAATVAITMIKNNQLSSDKQADFLMARLSESPRLTGLVRWGTSKLKKMNSFKSKNVLMELAKIDTPGFESLRHAASIKFKTMK